MNYKKKYVIGGAGIFESIGNCFARMFSSNAEKQLHTTKTKVVDEALESFKSLIKKQYIKRITSLQLKESKSALNTVSNRWKR